MTGSRDPEGYQRKIDWRLYHLRYWSLDEWRDALTREGFEVVDASYYMSKRETRRWAALSNATAGLLGRLTGMGSRPIEIQRRLGLRRSKAPLWLGGLGRSIGGAIGLGPDAGRVDKGSCLLVVARKVGPGVGE